MKVRKQINMSVDVDTYNRLKVLQAESGCKDLCQLMRAWVNIMLDAHDKRHEYVTNLDDENEIDKMFNEYGHAEMVPDGNAPVAHRRRNIDKI